MRAMGDRSRPLCKLAELVSRCGFGSRGQVIFKTEGSKKREKEQNRKKTRLEAERWHTAVRDRPCHVLDLTYTTSTTLSIPQKSLYPEQYTTQQFITGIFALWNALESSKHKKSNYLTAYSTPKDDLGVWVFRIHYKQDSGKKGRRQTPEIEGD